jgi:hypothetical protein
VATGIERGTAENLLPERFDLSEGFPNPFNPSTTFRYDIPVPSQTHIVVYDVLGREVRQLVNARREPGSYTVQFVAEEQGSGPLFCRMTATPLNGEAGYASVRKILVLK